MCKEDVKSMVIWQSFLKIPSHLTLVTVGNNWSTFPFITNSYILGDCCSASHQVSFSSKRQVFFLVHTLWNWSGVYREFERGVLTPGWAPWLLLQNCSCTHWSWKPGLLGALTDYRFTGSCAELNTEGVVNYEKTTCLLLSVSMFIA